MATRKWAITRDWDFTAVLVHADTEQEAVDKYERAGFGTITYEDGKVDMTEIVDEIE